MKIELAQAIRELTRNPALTEALQTLALALEHEGASDRLSALDDTCVSPAELDQLLTQLDAVVVALDAITQPGRH